MRILTSGSAWLGDEFGSIQTAVEEAIRSARNEILFVTYVLSAAADTTLGAIEDALQSGVSVRMVVNRFDNQHPAVQGRLRALMAKHERMRLFDFRDPSTADLHAKFLVIDHRIAIVGSANLTWRGLVANHELAILIDEPPVVDTVLAAAGRMLRSSMISEVE